MFTATVLSPIIEIVGGNNQMGYWGDQFPQSLQVQVKTGMGIPLEGVVVTFNIVEGDGFLSNSDNTTNVNGLAETQ